MQAVSKKITSWNELVALIDPYIAFNRVYGIPPSCFAVVVSMNCGTLDAINESANELFGCNKEWSDLPNYLIGNIGVPIVEHNGVVMAQVHILSVPDHELLFGEVKVRIRPHVYQKSLSPRVGQEACAVFN
jgi:hypothetical protein